MKKIFYVIAFIISVNVNAQTILSIRPNGAEGKDALIDSRTSVANTNYGTTNDLASWAWTNGGNNTVARGLFQFDLSQIPANATINTASLSLYCNTTSAITQLHSGTNESYLQKITSSWDESTVTWNNQPTTAATNQVSLNTSTSNTQNYLNIDVKQLVIEMKNNPTTSFGLMLMLKSEVNFRSLIFASSDHLDSTKRPVLVINYTTAAPCLNNTILKPNGTAGKDALIDSRAAVSGTNYGNSQDMASWAWTNFGNTIARSLIDFNLDTIPTNATLLEAKLSLFCNTTSAITQLHSGVNESYIQRITSTWEENTVTWNNQPTTTSVNQVSLNTSLNKTQDYLNVDITQLINDLRANKNSSFGLMLKLITEVNFRSLILASSDHPDQNKRPTLSLCYSLPSSVNEIANQKDIILFPNPINASEILTIQNPNEEAAKISLVDIQGKNIFTSSVLKGNNTIEVNLSQYGILSKGTYFVKLELENSVLIKKLIIQ
jgi:hypothetical protein